jgi:hypothetical protein
MRKIAILILTLNQSLPGVCQDYYISTANDTVRGAVMNYKEWAKNPSEIF